MQSPCNIFIDMIEFEGSKVQAREWLNKFYGIYKLKEKEPSVIININDKKYFHLYSNIYFD